MANEVTKGYIGAKDAEMTINIDISKYLKDVGKLEEITVAIKRGVDNGIKELSLRLQKKIFEYLTEYGLADNLSLGDVIAEPYEDGISIQVGGDYLVYVEYGTGIVGSEHPHPKPQGWQYMIGKHSSKGGGWWYPTTMNDPNPIKWNSPQGLYAWTKGGLPSRPFMYRTWLWGTRSANQIIQKNIRNELKKLGGGID